MWFHTCEYLNGVWKVLKYNLWETLVPVAYFSSLGIHGFLSCMFYDEKAMFWCHLSTGAWWIVKCCCPVQARLSAWRAHTWISYRCSFFCNSVNIRHLLSELIYLCSLSWNHSVKVRCFQFVHMHFRLLTLHIQFFFNGDFPILVATAVIFLFSIW